MKPVPSGKGPVYLVEICIGSDDEPIGEGQAVQVRLCRCVDVVGHTGSATGAVAACRLLVHQLRGFRQHRPGCGDG